MSELSDALYWYRREESNSVTVLTSAGTEDSYQEQCSSTTLFHKDRHWIIETKSGKTKYVIENGVPAFDMVCFAADYNMREEGDIYELRDLVEEISQNTGELESHIDVKSVLLRYRYRRFHVENCFGDHVSVEYPLIGLEVYVEGDMLHHISYGGCFRLSEFRNRVRSLFSEECMWINRLDRLESGHLEDFEVSSVAFSGYSLGTLLHEAVGHLLECDHARTLGIHRGDRYTTPAVVVSESPGIESSFGFCPCSDEGLELDETILLGDGVIQDFLTSLSMSESPYRNGRAQKCANLPLPRNTSLCMRKGKEEADVLFQYPRTLYIHKKIKPVLKRIVNGVPFYDVEVPTAYVVERGTFTHKVRNVHIDIGLDHFLDDVCITSRERGNQVGYCIKSQQQIESTQFAPDILIFACSVKMYEKID
jgi:predicted Zn-dependent protease